GSSAAPSRAASCALPSSCSPPRPIRPPGRLRCTPTAGSASRSNTKTWRRPCAGSRRVLRDDFRMRRLKIPQLTLAELLLADQLEKRWTGNIEANKFLVKPKAIDSSIFLVLANLDAVHRRDGICSSRQRQSWLIAQQSSARVNV